MYIIQKLSDIKMLNKQKEKGHCNFFTRTNLVEKAKYGFDEPPSINNSCLRH